MKKEQMTFAEVSRIANLLARDYAEPFLKLLVIYRSISASEAASRLALHIKTAQDFLDGLTEAGLLEKETVYEGKRPYSRYKKLKNRISIETDFSQLYDPSAEKDKARLSIREKANAPAVFSTAGSGQKIASVSVFTGGGRKRKEKKISVTGAQGQFLYHVPFPTEKMRTVEKIAAEAQVDKAFLPEIIDIVDLLLEFGVLETE